MTLSEKLIFTLKRKKWLIALLLVAVFVSLGFYTTWRTHYKSTDFDTYYYAGRDVLAGASVYTEHESISPYIYPPFFACLIAPFTLFSLEVTSVFWYILNLALFFLSILLSFRLIFDDKPKAINPNVLLSAPVILFFVMLTGLFIDNISMLQANISILFLVVAGLYFFKKKMDLPASFFLGLAISIKVIPILFLIYFIVKKEFKMAVFTALWTGLFSYAVPAAFMGPDNAWVSLDMWSKSMLFKFMSKNPDFDMLIYMFNPQNQSVTAFFSRWLIKNDFLIIHFKRMAHEYPAFLIPWTLSMTRESVFFISKVFTFLVGAVTFLCCFGKIKNRGDHLLNYEYSLMFLVSLIVNPVLKTQQMIFLMFPALLLLSRIIKPVGNGRFLRPAFLSFAFLYLSQVFGVSKMLGFGTLSILLLWGILLVSYRGLIRRV
ncbi:MAG: DUF2029 domain-containing protein [Candidatus Omnitrophica bacterium]|nr:DUF2029 domain-containing protein [Candidatus Omnitrophota bacterium]